MQTISTKKREGWVAPQDPLPEPRKRGIKVQLLKEVEVEEVKWLWYPYIPAGKLSLLEGDPGQGKSWITCALAADISAGRKLPGQVKALPPQKVLMLSAEDGLGDTVRPRIESMNGNMDNIFVSDDFFILDPQGIKDMEDAMRATSATIVFMDPIVAYMGSKVDMHRANEVRGLMTALAEAAKRTGAAIVAVRHLRKGQGSKAIYNGIGSIDFTAAVRSVMQVQESKGGTKFMMHAKHNLTPKGDAIAYAIEGSQFKWSGTFEDEENEKGSVSKVPLSVQKAKTFLFQTLKNGPASAAAIQEAAALAGVSLQALNKAKPGFVLSRKVGHVWMWELQERDGIDAPDRPLLPEAEKVNSDHVQS